MLDYHNVVDRSTKKGEKNLKALQAARNVHCEHTYGSHVHSRKEVTLRGDQVFHLLLLHLRE